MKIDGEYYPSLLFIHLVADCDNDMLANMQAMMNDAGFANSDYPRSYSRKFSSQEEYDKWWQRCDRLCKKFGGSFTLNTAYTPEPAPVPVVDMESIANKIKKLLALSQSPNEAEAIAASRKAQDLLTRYNLSMADVADPQAIDEEVEQQTLFHLDSKREWIITLLDGVARANFCSMIMTSGKGYGTDCKLIGRPSNIAVASLMYEYLSETVERLAKTTPNTTGEKGFRNSFRLGCANRLYWRLLDTIKEQCENGITSDDGVNCSAIAVTSLYEQRKMEVEKYKNNTYGKIPSHRCRNSISSNEGYAAGDRAGQQVSLNKQVGSSGVQRQLRGS